MVFFSRLQFTLSTIHFKSIWLGVAWVYLYHKIGIESSLVEYVFNFLLHANPLEVVKYEKATKWSQVAVGTDD